MLCAQFNTVLSLSALKIKTCLFTSAFAYISRFEQTQRSALHLKHTFCLPDAWPREICRVSLFVCLRAHVYDMFTKYLFIMQRSGSVLAGLGGKWRVLFVSLAVSGGCFAQIQGGN